MGDKQFIWTPSLTKKLFQLKFQNDWLFKEKKQPWHYFHKILLDSGFPEEMTVDHVRKKWSYTYDSYKIAKMTKNKKWKYYKIFDKHYGKIKIFDKFDSWNEEWRLKLIIAITEARALKLDNINMWKTVERTLRCQSLPSDCCILDVKVLWHHLRTVFNRKHKMGMRRGVEECEWALYEPVLRYYERFEPELLGRLGEARRGRRSRPRGAAGAAGAAVDHDEDMDEFVWTKDITESFIQVKLQNDWLFREKKWVWNEMRNIMVREGFPKNLTARDCSRKWASMYSEYQKAKATNNTSWLYYNLFECYLGDGSFSLNPLLGWAAEWVMTLIGIRKELEPCFKQRSPWNNGHLVCWREVEKRLRSAGLPLENSLFDIEEIWLHLLKTYRWKHKFANKGILNEKWPYYEAMADYMKIRAKPLPRVKKQVKLPALREYNDDRDMDDDFDDDIKLFDLKQRMLQPKVEVLEVNSCRACTREEGCVNIFEPNDANGLDFAHKLRVVCGVEIDKNDNLPKQICFGCVTDLENAYRFREKCQLADVHHRSNSNNNTSDDVPYDFKVEIKCDADGKNKLDNAKSDADSDFRDHLVMDIELDDGLTDEEYKPTKPKRPKKEKKTIFRKKKAKKEYVYRKVCEVCGKSTKNLKAHLDTHTTEKLYNCDLCDKSFKFKSGLQIHRAIHDPQPKKTCEICGKKFHIVAQYKRHFVYHANERKYGCETCGKRFNTVDILKVHARMHTDERPFSCRDCGKSFRTAGCVSRHRRIVHKNASKNISTNIPNIPIDSS